MIKSFIPQIKKIFVGRHLELQQLEELWDFSCQDEEHFVYVFLNAPGVGKTTLINHFGKSLESEDKGIFIKFVCNSDYDSPSRLNKNLIKAIDKKINQKFNFIERFITKNFKKGSRERFRQKLKHLQNFIDELLMKSIISLNDITDIFLDLAEIIPIFFSADEIQEFQKCDLINSFDKENKEGEKETALHYLTRLLKNLLNSRILLVLSGTRYHILSQIGGSIGSPIRQKVKTLILQKFEPEEVMAYVEQVKNLIKSADLKLKPEKMSVIIEYYQNFLFAFSGGHPRAIENITEIFLINLSFLTKNNQYSNYDAFLDFLLPKIEEFFSNTLISSIHKNALLELTVSEQFSEVKDWILARGSHGQLLGPRPTIIDDSFLDNEIKRITYDLVNIGIIVQNGNYNYHLTSYFYFLEFLKIYHEPYEVFLKQVLHNKYFKLICGRHTGFGYTFENIFLSALIIYGIKNKEKSIIPLKVSSLRSLEIIKGKIKWSEHMLEPNVLYHSPEAKAVDAILIQEKELLLIQITTTNPPTEGKISNLSSEIKKISKIGINLGKELKIRGWFVSLFDFKETRVIDENILITAGDDLIPILGKQLYSKLKVVKESF
ncbi:MAG: ATP-binding protein [Promethearchaeota archaeon]